MGKKNLTRITEKAAPAVALLMLGEKALAGIPGPDTGTPVPEPSTWGLLAIGAVAGGAAALARKRRKKK